MQLGAPKDKAMFLDGPTSKYTTRSQNCSNSHHLDPLLLFGLSASVYPCLETLPPTAMTHLKVLARPPHNLEYWSQSGEEWKTEAAKGSLPVVYDQAAHGTGNANMKAAVQAGESSGVHSEDEQSESEVGVNPKGKKRRRTGVRGEETSGS
jgi:hypothetical protein